MIILQSSTQCYPRHSISTRASHGFNPSVPLLVHNHYNPLTNLIPASQKPLQSPGLNHNSSEAIRHVRSKPSGSPHYLDRSGSKSNPIHIHQIIPPVRPPTSNLTITQPPTDTSKPTAPSDSKITYQAEQSDDTSDERLTEPSATPVAQPKQKWCPKEDQFTNASADATTTPSSGRKSKSSFSDSSATKKRGSISMGRGSAEKPIKKRGSIGGEEKDPTTPNKATKSAASTPGIASRKRKVGPKSAADFTREDKMLIQLKKNGDSWKRIKELLGGDCDGLTLTGLRSRYRRLAVIATEWTEDDVSLGFFPFPPGEEEGGQSEYGD